MSTDPAPRAIELTEFEKVVARGVHKQTWWVNLDGRWWPVGKVPGAVVVTHLGKPGVVWHRHVQLSLVPGTCLRLETQKPQPANTRDVFSVITLDARATTRLGRVEFCVSKEGALEPRSR